MKTKKQIVRLKKELLEALFENHTHQTEVIVAIYNMVFPDWDKIKKIHGWPKISNMANEFFFDKSCQFIVWCFHAFHEGICPSEIFFGIFHGFFLPLVHGRFFHIPLRRRVCHVELDTRVFYRASNEQPSSIRELDWIFPIYWIALELVYFW